MPFSSFCPFLLNLSVFHFSQRPFCFLGLCAVCVGRRKNFSLGKNLFSHYHAEHLDSWRLSLQSNQYLNFLIFSKYVNNCLKDVKAINNKNVHLQYLCKRVDKAKYVQGTFLCFPLTCVCLVLGLLN